MSRNDEGKMDRRRCLKMMGAAAGALALDGLVTAPAARAGTPAPATKGKTVRFAHIYPLGWGGDRAAREFAKWIGERTNGELTVNVFPGGQLGAEKDQIESVQMGAIEIGMFGTLHISTITPEWGLVLDSPYIFRDQAHLRKIVDGPLAKPMYDALLERKGIRHVAWFNRGPRHMSSNKSVKEPADLKGVRIRVPEIETFVYAWKTLGATVTPMAFPEIFMALKTGTIDAVELPMELIYSSSLYEVQKYLNLTYHMVSVFDLTVSEVWFKTLSPELKKVVTDGLMETGKLADKIQAEDEDGYEKKLKEKGMIFNPVDISKFQAALKDLPKHFEKTWKPGFYDQIQAVK